MSDFEKVLDYLRKCAREIQGDWNGDEAGKQELRAESATELLELLEQVETIVKDLDI